MENLSSKTLKELKDYAEEKNIDLKDARTKAKVLSIILDSDTDKEVHSQYVPEVVSSAASNDSGVVVSRQAEGSGKKITKIGQEESEKVAVHSKKNMRWQGVGQISAGYNIVKREDAEKWVTLSGVRLATPEEVASYYGKG